MSRHALNQTQFAGDPDEHEEWGMLRYGFAQDVRRRSQQTADEDSYASQTTKAQKQQEESDEQESNQS